MACNIVQFDPQRATKPSSILNHPKVDFMQTSDQVLARLQVPSQWSLSPFAYVETQRPYVTHAFNVAANQNSGTTFCREQDVGKVALALGAANAPYSLGSPHWVVQASPN